MRLPDLPNRGNITGSRQAAWGGLDHTPGAQGGAIYAMENLTSADYPLLATRPPRHTIRTLENPQGICKADKLYYADNYNLYDANGERLTSYDDEYKGERTIIAMGKRLLIWPDKMIYTEENGLEWLDIITYAQRPTIHDGTYAGEPAEGNSLTIENGTFFFKAGDAVEITGCTVVPSNNKTAIIREISEDKKTLRFYENTFTIPQADPDTRTTSYTETGWPRLERKVPDLDFLCVNENRVWGCKDDTIWCSKLGDPFNWYVFDGLSTDSWSVESGTPGKFTGCVSYLGYPCFFKEDKVFKVYGNRPSNFELMSSATMGVTEGNHKSLAIAGETLFYMSRAGIVAYRGGVPQSIAAPFGHEKFTDAVGGTDGLKYYVSMQDSAGVYSLYVYDTEKGMWHREDNTRLLFTAYDKGLVAVTEDGDMVLLGIPEHVPDGATEEGPVSWYAEFADFTMDSFNGKYPVRMRLRFEGDAGASITAAIRYDSAGEWQTFTTLAAGTKKAVYLALPIKRCDHFRVKISGTGAARLYAWEFELYEEDYTRK